MNPLILVAATAALLAVPGPRKAPQQRMNVVDVMSTGDDQFVVLLQTVSKPLKYLPIWVGEGEAAAIRMRLDRREPPRPLTLNLLEQVLRQANIRVTEIAIDDFKAGIFLGHIKLKNNARVWDMETRPADAIGLALSRKAPLMVACDIVNAAAIDPQTLEAQPTSPKTAPGQPARTPEVALDETL